MSRKFPCVVGPADLRIEGSKVLVRYPFDVELNRIMRLNNGVFDKRQRVWEAAAERAEDIARDIEKHEASVKEAWSWAGSWNADRVGALGSASATAWGSVEIEVAGFLDGGERKEVEAALTAVGANLPRTLTKIFLSPSVPVDVVRRAVAEARTNAEARKVPGAPPSGCDCFLAAFTAALGKRGVVAEGAVVREALNSLLGTEGLAELDDIMAEHLAAKKAA